MQPSSNLSRRNAAEQEDVLVSVIVPAFNAARTISRALSSIGAQTHGAIEVIVVDDKSTDETLAVLGAWTKFPIRVIALDENAGPARARNAGLAVATGRYVAFLDADDEWLPEKTVLQAAALQDNPEATLVVCDAACIDECGKTVAREFADAPPVQGADAWRALLRYSFIATPCVMARRAVFDEVGKFDTSLSVAEDQDMWIRMALAGPVLVIDKPLVRIHVSPASHMRKHATREADFLLPMIERHVAQQRHRLSDAERREMLGTRLGQIGRNAYIGGAPAVGARLLMRAAAIGHDPVGQVLFLLHASRPGRAVKRLLKRNDLRHSSAQHADGPVS